MDPEWLSRTAPCTLISTMRIRWQKVIWLRELQRRQSRVVLGMPPFQPLVLVLTVHRVPPHPLVWAPTAFRVPPHPLVSGATAFRVAPHPRRWDPTARRAPPQLFVWVLTARRVPNSARLPSDRF